MNGNAMIIWTPGVKLEEVEKQAILAAFSYYRGNKTATASALGIAVRTLDTRLEQYEKEEDAHDQRRKEHAAKRADERKLHQSGRPGSTTGDQSGLDAVDSFASNVWPEPGDVPRVEGNRVIPARPKQKGDETGGGVRLESGERTSEERDVSVRKPEEIQEVLPSKLAIGGTRRGR